MRRHVRGRVFDCDIVNTLPGIITLRIDGQKAWDLFQHEAGGHRWQRVPPTERRGRMQTSTFTVAVFKDGKRLDSFSESDVELQYTKGSGPGGQHRNKTESAVRAIHKPTGVSVFCQTNRSQHANKAEALRLLKAKIEESANAQHTSTVRVDRKQQIGSGQRGDKARTIQVQNAQVINHVNGKEMNLNAYLKGEIWKIH